MDADFKVWLDSVTARFSELSSVEQNETLNRLLAVSDTSQLHYLSQRLNETTCRDFIGWLPPELSQRILTFLDLPSMLYCCQVSTRWNHVVSWFERYWKSLILRNGFLVSDALCGDLLKKTYLQQHRSLKRLSKGLALDAELLAGHTARVTALCYNEGRLASGSDDRTVRIWDCQTAKCLTVIHSHTIADLKFDSARVVTASFDRTAACWEVSTGRCLREYRGHTSAVLCLDYNAVLDVLATGSADHTIRCWSLQRGKLHTVLETHELGWVKHVSIVRAGADTNTAFSLVASDGTCLDAWTMDGPRCRLGKHRCLMSELFDAATVQAHAVIDARQEDLGVAVLHDDDVVRLYTLIAGCTSVVDVRAPGLESCNGLRDWMGRGKCYDVCIGYYDVHPVIYVTASTGEVVACLPIQTQHRPSYVILGDKWWLDGLRPESQNGMFAAVALQHNHNILMMRWKQSKKQRAGTK